MNDTVERYGQPQQSRGLRECERYTEKPEERYTSVSSTLSLNNYTYYDPSDRDLGWLHYLAGPLVDSGKVNVLTQTERFNLKCAQEQEFDMKYQGTAWKLFMLRAIEYAERQL